MTKITYKKIAIMGFIAIASLGMGVFGIAEAIEPLTIQASQSDIVDKINEMISEYNNRISAIENAIDNIHEHSFIRADFILGEVVNNEQIVALCEVGEIAIGGGYGLADSGLRVIVVLNQPEGYAITINGTATLSGSNAGVTVICLPIP